MKLHTDTNAALNTVTGYGHGYVEINKTTYSHAIAFGPEGPVRHWLVENAEDISTAHLLLAAGLALKPIDPLAFLDSDQPPQPEVEGDRPEVLLVGTGSRQRMLDHKIISPLLRAGVGVECMTTEAAARTYNILMAEGRQVIAALLPEKI
ncbi:Mth938-like domain-containing protein [Zwartia panacis]|uniref:Mth938-like domain-containing protein n=1 Tax=Zwartia panacis TaxID=2683345 RepID=UPI0025B288BC|nr:MTH938/NDUFAF3 family protein [Zwartia panacis]MDN4018230.1 MTH938/NDUFAF3 family protein [Zwartia panacis]